MTDLDPRERWVPLAEIARPHGVRGELRLRLFNAESDALLGRDEVLVRLPSGEEHEVTVERARRAGDALLVKLYSIDDRDRAGELRGALVCLRRRDLEEPEDGEFYTVDALGAEVRLGGARLGEVAEIMSYPTVQVVRVRADDGEGDWEVPLTDTFVARADVAGRVFELLTLDGLEREVKKKRVPRAAKVRRPRRGGADAAGNAGAAGDGDPAGDARDEGAAGEAGDADAAREELGDRDEGAPGEGEA